MTKLSHDALIFGLGYLRGPNNKLSFGGEGAEMMITPRARAALDELIAAGYVAVSKPSDQIPGREHYEGMLKDPHLGALAKASGMDPFSDDHRWASFTKIAQPEAEADSFTM